MLENYFHILVHERTGFRTKFLEISFRAQVLGQKFYDTSLRKQVIGNKCKCIFFRSAENDQLKQLMAMVNHYNSVGRESK